MNRTVLITLSLIVAAGLLAAGYGLGRMQQHDTIAAASHDASHAAPHTAPAGEPQKPGDVDPATGRKVLYWHDPMVPGHRFDKPGKSPFMDMMLEPVFEDAGTDGSTVSIDPRVRQNIGVRTAQVTRARLAAPLTAVGTVAFNERDQAAVQARANGFVEKLFVRAPFDSVRAGQPLAEVYVPDWVAAQEEYLATRAMRGADAIADAAKQRMRLAGMTEEQVARVVNEGKAVPRMTIVAPIGGVVTELAVREGMTVAMGAPLFRIAGLGSVWINAELPEADAARVRPGMPVDVRATSMPGTTWKGKVSAILPDVNVQTRTIKARIEVANPGGKLVPGVFASIDLMPQSAPEVIAVPSEAVIATGKRTVVFVAEDEGRFRAVPVETGTEALGMTEIRKGITPGQRVVVSGQFLIDSEASLKGTGTRMEPPEAAPAEARPMEAKPTEGKP
ncbi:MAG: efflux RND transporter periplasmic adaptor subunit [Burkholderiales bacterium]